MSYTLKLSESTLAVLKNFGSIQKNLLVRPGKKLATISETKSVITVAQVAEEFKSSFAIFDVNRFLSALSLYKDPEIIVGDKSANITDGDRQLSYTWTDPSSVLTVEDQSIDKISSVVGDGDAQFVLTNAQFKDVQKALNVLQLPNFEVRGDGQEITFRAVDSTGTTKDNYAVKVGETDQTFSAIFSSGNLKLLPFDYTVKYSKRGLSRWSATDIEYFIATESKKA